jgi:hypothetical protein
VLLGLLGSVKEIDEGWDWSDPFNLLGLALIVDGSIGATVAGSEWLRARGDTGEA